MISCNATGKELTKRERKMSAKWRCHCGDLFQSIGAFVSHSRRQHADYAYGLWDAAGTLGDKFADGALREVEAQNKRKLDELRRGLPEMEQQAKAYDALVLRHNELVRRLHIVKLAVEGPQ